MKTLLCYKYNVGTRYSLSLQLIYKTEWLHQRLLSNCLWASSYETIAITAFAYIKGDLLTFRDNKKGAILRQANWYFSLDTYGLSKGLKKKGWH